jgi:hypothetical protein
MVNIETTFIGIVESCRYRYDRGVEGIYVKPLYICDIMKSEWYKIVDLEQPKTKYFVYPHLLMLRQYNYPSCYYPLYNLQTCEKKSLNEFINIEKTRYLCSEK